MKKVLIIDDDPDILEAIQLLLENFGFNSEATTKSDDITHKIAEFKPDLILLDILLSGNDGRSICQELKESKNTQQIPVIMMSAHPAAKESLINCGADYFLPKPFSIADLISVINKHLS